MRPSTYNFKPVYKQLDALRAFGLVCPRQQIISLQRDFLCDKRRYLCYTVYGRKATEQKAGISLEFLIFQIKGQGRRSLWYRGTRPPKLGGHYHECPPQYFWSNISYFLSMQYFIDKLKEFSEFSQKIFFQPDVIF